MRRIVLTAFIAAAATLSAAAQPAARPVRQFISLSDIHFDPYYDPSLMTQLEAADVSQWPAIFASSTITAPSAYGADTNYPLLVSMLADLKTRAAGAEFVTISGDFLGHDFPQLFQQYSPDKSSQAYQSFVTKTVQFIAAQLQATVPKHVEIFPTLGNNDSDCGDYEITPNGWFLSMFAKAFAPSIKSKSFVQDFSPDGSYAVRAPVPDTILIGLNSIFFSSNYDNACGQEGVDYGAQQLKWLAKQLADAERKHKRVWLLYHIPPGINVYSTLNGWTSCPTPVTMWESQYTKAFDALMLRYASTIPVSLAGHTHMDDFRVMATTTSPFAYVHISPAVSPMFTNNPAYESIAYAVNTGALIDYTVFNLPLGSPPPAWGTEYTFSSAYGQTAYDPATINTVRNEIGSNPATRALYMQYYTASNPASTTITEKNWKGYWCGTGAQAGAGFTACYCPPVPPPAAPSTP